MSRCSLYLLQTFEQPGPGLIESGPEFCRAEGCRIGTGHYHQLDTCELLLMVAKGFTYQAFEPVALHGVTEVFLGSDQPEPGC